MDDSDSSSLSSVAPDEEVQKLAPIFLKAKKATKLIAPPPKTPPRPKRAPSPPHEDVFADNPDVAFIVMFRSRFHAAFPPKLAHFGPQDIERGVFDDVPSPQAEALLCALLGLVLNRKKPVEQGHHGRALEEAIQTHKSQWPLQWEGKNPLSGSQDFKTMTPENRLYLLRTLIMWSLTSSEEISAIIRNSYKQNRHNDDENQPLSVQPWGRDGDKRRYFLVEGQDDTSFRVYREGHRSVKNIQWYSMAGDIEEVKVLAEKLDKDDGSQAARTLAQRMLAAIPRFEATEEVSMKSQSSTSADRAQKRKRREYRQVRRAQFTRPEPGFSLYEGRTRGKRMRYTYDEDDENAFLSDATSTRRSGRHSERDTPVDAGPVTTLSGRQVKPRRGGEYGASLLSGQSTTYDTPDYDDGTDASDAVLPAGRATRGARASNGQTTNGKHRYVDDYNDEDMSEEEDAIPSGEEWDSEENEKDDYDIPDADAEDEDEDIDEEELDELGVSYEPKSLVVKLRVSGASNTQPEVASDTKQEQHKDDIIATAALDTPTHLAPAPAQAPLSGYPTPASLPLVMPKTEYSAPATAQPVWQQAESHQPVQPVIVQQPQ
ncbi:hypothetical protein AMS68_004052 [Peltaster fructicola]|uniref:WHIM1 domain-containing protein n=1 Tax=Peltaster fructicola TaxID=286661 RepID=A0A6H0XV51_9PEZI|nr:hypothetical protein AMS68_004052 [Peltaster fructicola]